MNKIKIKILESVTAKGCKHDVLTCKDCGSIIMMREPKKFNVKRFKKLALAVDLRNKLMDEFLKENPLTIDDEIEERFESWLADRK